MVWGMPLREFQDGTGERWRVWDTVPARAESMGEFREGWLTFDNGTERRRLAPVPERWSEFPDERLILLLRVAHAPHASARGPSAPAADRRVAERREGERRLGDRRRGEA
jgi:hypothetical protein